MTGICAEELRQCVIKPTLKHLGYWSPAAENLLLGTAAQESGLGTHLRLARKKALGLYQITPDKHRRIWDHYLAYHPNLASKVRGLASQREFLQHPHSELVTNLSYATAIAWAIYLRSSKPLHLHDSDQPEQLGQIWRSRFHNKSQGSIEEFVRQYNNLIISSAI